MGKGWPEESIKKDLEFITYLMGIRAKFCFKVGGGYT